MPNGPTSMGLPTPSGMPPQKMKLTAEKKGIITIDKIYGGWVMNNNGSYPTEEDQMQWNNFIAMQIFHHYSQGSAINPLRGNFKGHIAPGETFTILPDTNGYVTSLPLNAVATPDNNYLAVLQGDASVVSFGIGSINHKYSLVTASPSGTYSDIIVYRDGAGTSWALWSWETASTANVAAMHTSGSNESDTWFSSLSGGAALTVGVPKIMLVGTNGNIYITNGQYIASAINTAGGQAITALTGNAQACNLGPGWVATSMANYGNYIAIVAYKNTAEQTGFTRSETRLFLWDGNYLNTAPNYVYDIYDSYVSAIHNKGGTLYVFTVGKEGKMRIKQYDGQGGFTTAFEYSFGTNNNPPPHGSVDDYMQQMCFYQQARTFDLAYFDGSYYHDAIFTGSLDKGFVKNLDSIGIYIGMKTSGSTYGIGVINESGYNVGSFFKSCLQVLPFKSKITSIKFYFSQWKAGSSIQVNLYRGYDAATDLLNGPTISYNTNGSFPTYALPVNIEDIDSFWLQVTFNHATSLTPAAIIRRIEVEFQPGNEII